MRSFGIAELERLSGLKAHTIRTWEERFGILKPARTEGNFRSYSLEDLKYILSLALLNQNGHKISRLSQLSDAELNSRLANLTDIDCRYKIAINDLLFCMYSLDFPGFERELSNCFSNWDASIVVTYVIQTFLKLTGLEWKGNHLLEEHMVVTILRSKLLHSIEEISISAPNTKVVLLFLHEAKYLDLSLLCVYHKLKSEGIKVIYMGNDVSIDNLSKLLDTTKLDLAYTYLPAKAKMQTEKLAPLFSKKLHNGKIIITCAADNEKDVFLSDNMIFANIEEAILLMLK